VSLAIEALLPLLRGERSGGGDLRGAPVALMQVADWLVRRSRAGAGGAALGQFMWSLAERCRGLDPAETIGAVQALAAARPGLARAATALAEAIVAGQPRAIEAAAALVEEEGSEAEMLGFLDRTLYRGRALCPRYAGWPAALDSMETFRSLPILTRADLDADIASVCAAGAPVDYFTATSATTTGQALLVPHAMDELHSLAAYAEGLARAPGGGEEFLEGGTSPLGGMTLRLMPAGRLIGSPSADGRTVVATYETNAARENIFDLWDYIIGQVFLEFPTSGGPLPINTIHATPAFGLILLTKYMLQRGIDPASSGVRHLIVSGSWIGRHTRRRLQQSWNAVLHNTYSCSELTGAAVEVPGHPGRYRFGAHVHLEIVDADTAEPVPIGGEGKVVLSGTYPFHQSAVLLRYENGDWGRWIGVPEGSSFGEFEMLGRTRDIQRLEDRQGRRLVIGSVPIREALDAFDFVPKIPRPQFVVRVEDGKVPIVRFEVECYAIAGAIWRRSSEEAVQAAILEQLSALRDSWQQGDVEVAVRLFYRSRLTNSSAVI
jgi:hypothetical protein